MSRRVRIGGGPNSLNFGTPPRKGEFCVLDILVFAQLITSGIYVIYDLPIDFHDYVGRCILSHMLKTRTDVKNNPHFLQCMKCQYELGQKQKMRKCIRMRPNSNSSLNSMRMRRFEKSERKRWRTDVQTLARGTKHQICNACRPSLHPYQSGVLFVIATASQLRCGWASMEL